MQRDQVVLRNSAYKRYIFMWIVAIHAVKVINKSRFTIGHQRVVLLVICPNVISYCLVLISLVCRAVKRFGVRFIGFKAMFLVLTPGLVIVIGKVKVNHNLSP